MPKHTRIVIDTLGNLTPEDHIRVYCLKCEHKADLDIPALIEKKGATFEVIALVPLLKCQSCGAKGRDVQFNRSHSGRYTGERYSPN